MMMTVTVTTLQCSCALLSLFGLSFLLYSYCQSYRSVDCTMIIPENDNVEKQQQISLGGGFDSKPCVGMLPLHSRGT